MSQYNCSVFHTRPSPPPVLCFQLIFEVVRSGFDGRVAIDDVSFVDRECAVPRMCSFEDQRCGFTTSGEAAWHHRNGHSSTAVGPRIDHTLETPTGEGQSIREEVYDVVERRKGRT